MRSDIPSRLDEVTSRLGVVLETKSKHTVLRDRVADDLLRTEQEVAFLRSEVEILTKVSELFRVLMNALIEKQVRSVESISTEGLQAVFYDLGLSLEADVDPKYGKVSVDLFIRKGEKGTPTSHRGRPLDAFGGGPSSFISLILRILTIKKLGLHPFLLLDESMGAISDEYIDRAGQFVRALSDQLGLDLLLVTHKAAFIDHAHSYYRCQEEVEADGVTSYVNIRKGTS